MASQDNGPPPKKSRRLASKQKNTSSHSNTVEVTIKDQIVEAVTAAIPSITQTVVKILQQGGFIGADNINLTQNGNNNIVSQNLANQTPVNDISPSTAAGSNSTNLNDSVILEGSRHIPLIDLSPSACASTTTGSSTTNTITAQNNANQTDSQDSNSFRTETVCSNANLNTPAAGAQVINSLLSGEVTRYQRYGSSFRKDSNRCVTPDVPTLKQSAETFIQNALMPSSVATYERAVAYYKHFLSIYFPQTQIVPSSVEKLTMFIAFCSHNLLACSTITTYISVLSYLHKLGGYLDVTQTFVVKKALQGLRKLQGNTDTRLPITYSILKELIASLQYTCKSFFIHILLKAMYLFAFHAFLRVGEMTHSKLSAKNNLQFDSIEFQFNASYEPVAIELRMKNFKHSTGKSCHIMVIENITINEAMCPVKALWQYCKLRGNGEGPLFCFMDKTPISRQFFTEQLKLSLGYCNKDIKSYKGHSFRIGAASHAATVGISDEQIQIMGRWNSNAFKKYIRIHMLKR